MVDVPADRIGSLTVGLALGLGLVGVWAAAYGVGIGPFPPFDLADLIIRRAPGGAATWAIESFGHSAQRLLEAFGILAWIAAVAAIVLALGSGIGARRCALLGVALTPLPVGTALLAGGTPAVGTIILWVCSFGASLTAASWLAGRWLTRLSAHAAERVRTAGVTRSWLDDPGNLTRREVLREAAVVAVVAGLGGSWAGWLGLRAGVGEGASAAGTELPAARATVASAATPSLDLPTPAKAPAMLNTFPAAPGTRPRVTDNADFYVVDISTRDPNIPESNWTLRVHGLTERELVLSWTDLLAMPAIEIDGTLMCISFTYGSDLISTTRWTGVPLRDVLERAGVRNGAVDLVARGANDYSDSIPIAKALEPTTLLAYAMNGETLLRRHGFPCRLYVPGLYGEKNVKWLREIELVDYDYSGYWQERGWTDIATINTITVIDTPTTDVPRDSSGAVPIGGIAFAGNRGISRVQVQIDDGEWLDTALEEYAPPLVWQRWRLDWRPEPGTYTLTARATDSAGEPQIETPRDPHPDGLTGLQSIRVRVR